MPKDVCLALQRESYTLDNTMDFGFVHFFIAAIVSFLCSFVLSGIEKTSCTYVGYLFLHFYEGVTGEQVFGHLSNGNDALSFSPLNDDQPLLRSTVGTGGVRDFYLTSKGDDSQHYLIATDLNMSVTGFGGPLSRSIVVWDSIGSSLTQWSEPRLVNFVPDSFRMVWAPEAYWIEDEQRFIVFWSSNRYADSRRIGNTDNNRIYYAYTDDFKSFTEENIYLDLETEGVIDLTVHWTGIEDQYVRFFKRESVCQCRGQVSETGIFGTFRDIGEPEQSVDNDTQNEACLFFQDNLDATWWVWIDEYWRDPDGYYSYKADNGITEYGYTDQGQGRGFPSHTKHGSVKRLTQSQYDEVKAFWS